MPNQFNQGIKLELSVVSRHGLAANLFDLDDNIKQDVIVMNHDFGEFTKELIQQFCPKDTWYMHDTVRVEYTDLTFEAGWSFEDYVDHLNGFFYPEAQELGNSRVNAQPSLGPAYRITAPRYKAELSVILKEAVARMSRKINS